MKTGSGFVIILLLLLLDNEDRHRGLSGNDEF